MARFLGRTIQMISGFYRSFSAAASAQADRSAAQPPAGECSPNHRKTHLRDVDWLPGERRRQKFIDLYLFAVDAGLRGGADQWWQRAFGYDRFPEPEQGVESLKDFCLQSSALRSGRHPGFLPRLQDSRRGRPTRRRRSKSFSSRVDAISRPYASEAWPAD
jgi:hypothetical protein